MERRKAHPSHGSEGWARLRRRLLGLDEVAATVFLPAGLVGFHAEGLFLAIADRGEAVGRNAQADEILLDGVGAAIAESQVVFSGAAFVAMALDGDAELRIVAEEVGGLTEGILGVGANISLVVIEVGVTHFLKEEFVQGGLGSLDDRRRRRNGDGDAHAGFGTAAGARGSDAVGGRVGRRYRGGALRGDGANFRGDGNILCVGGGPCQTHGFALFDGGAIGADGGRGLYGNRSRGRRWRRRSNRLLAGGNEECNGTC